jgi:carboxyl-terminal processing protease
MRSRITCLHGRSATFRTALLLGVAFLAGTAVWPVSSLLARHRALAINAAYAQDADGTGTYGLLRLFGDAFELARSEYVDPVSDKALVENAINGMLTGLDPHSSYLNAGDFREMQTEDKGQFGGIGIEVTEEDGSIKVISSMDDTPASKAGIRAGDVIVGLNGKPVRGFSQGHAIDQMRGPPNTRITLTIRRQGVEHPLEISMRRAVIHIAVVKRRLEPDGIGYVRITEFIGPVDATLRQSVRLLRRKAGGRLKGLVLDLRDNPGGLLDQAVAVARDFIPHGAIVSTRSRQSDDGEWVAATGTDILNGAPMVVLINSGSASASEVVAGALKDHRRAVLLGTRTFGKGSVQATIPLSGGAAMLLTTERYYTPSGRSIQGRGIAPDVPVADSADGQPQFEPEHETDLNHVLRNAGGTADDDEPPRTDLPTAARTIPARPPPGAPGSDPAKPDTDFQLQQALVLVRAMAGEQKGASQASKQAEGRASAQNPGPDRAIPADHPVPYR